MLGRVFGVYKLIAIAFVQWSNYQNVLTGAGTESGGIARAEDQFDQSLVVFSTLDNRMRHDAGAASRGQQFNDSVSLFLQGGKSKVLMIKCSHCRGIFCVTQKACDPRAQPLVYKYLIHKIGRVLNRLF